MGEINNVGDMTEEPTTAVRNDNLEQFRSELVAPTVSSSNRDSLPSLQIVDDNKGTTVSKTNESFVNQTVERPQSDKLNEAVSELRSASSPQESAQNGPGDMSKAVKSAAFIVNKVVAESLAASNAMKSAAELPFAINRLVTEAPGAAGRIAGRGSAEVVSLLSRLYRSSEKVPPIPAEAPTGSSNPPLVGRVPNEAPARQNRVPNESPFVGRVPNDAPTTQNRVPNESPFVGRVLNKAPTTRNRQTK